MSDKATLHWPESLIDAASRGECVLFIGAGVSRHARQKSGDDEVNETDDDKSKGDDGTGGASPVGWRTLLETLLDHIEPPIPNKRPRNRTQITSKITSGDYLGAAQAIEGLYESRGIGSDFRSRIAGIVDGPADNPFRPAKVHDAIADLNPRIIVTTNYDNVLERKFSEGYRSLTYESTSVGSAIRNGSYLILKMHGTKDEPANLVLTRLDFTRLRRTGLQSLSVLEALFQTRTILFLGYSMGDPDLQLILENQFGAVGEPAGHYMLAHDKSHSEIERKILREAYGVELLTYPGEISKGLVAAVEDLVERTRGFELGQVGSLP